MKLPDYKVVLWHRSPSTPPDLFAQIILKSNKQPDGSSEYRGFRDIHWGFSSANDAISFAESLLEFAALEDVTKLVIIGANDASLGRKVLKDSMAAAQQ